MYSRTKADMIRNGLRDGFKDGSSKVARCKWYGYTIGKQGELIINEEAKIVRWIFDLYLSGNSLGNIADDALARQKILSPTSRVKWNREAINKILSNEKYIGSVLLQKTVCINGSQVKNNGSVEQYLYGNDHVGIISIEQFKMVQEEKQHRAKNWAFTLWSGCPSAKIK